jgi:hypothetical protein
MIMSFGLTDYNSNADLFPKPNEVKNEPKVTNTGAGTDTETVKTDDGSPADFSQCNAQQPLVDNQVNSYKDGSSPSMLDFGLFDYKHAEKDFPTKNSILGTLANKDFKDETEQQWQQNLAVISQTPIPYAMGNVNQVMSEVGEGSASVSMLEKMEQIIQESNG